MRAETPPSAPRSLSVQELRADLRRFQRALRVETRDRRVVSTGIAALDDILPDRGLQRGALSEWIASERGSGAATLALQACRQAQREGPLIIVDSERSVYAPAVHAAGLQLKEIVLVRPASRTDFLWAVEQSLRCSGVGAVLCRIDYLKTQEFRRLQLAAEAGTAVGVLIRPAAAHKHAGWADVRLLITPRPVTCSAAGRSRSASALAAGPPWHRRLEVRCVYAKGGFTDQTVELELCDETGAVRLAAGLSHSTTALLRPEQSAEQSPVRS